MDATILVGWLIMLGVFLYIYLSFGGKIPGLEK